MGWKGTIRSVNAAYKRGVREYEREERRRLRELEKERRELEKMEALAQAEYEVESFENLIACLTTVHKEPIENIDWEGIVEIRAPEEPQRISIKEKEAENAFASYKPSFWDKLFSLSEKKKNVLKKNIAEARNIDEKNYQSSLEKFRSEFIDWNDRTFFARRILDGELVAYNEAIEGLNLFDELKNFGCNVDVKFQDSKTSVATCHIQGEEIIPKEKKTLTQTGKLSTKQMPRGEFFEHFQDHVCSSALRIAHELFESLPVDNVIVTISDTMLNSSTGYLEDQPILSVRIPRETLESLNLEYIDASDSMNNFIHNMNFKKTSGFTPIEPL